MHRLSGETPTEPIYFEYVVLASRGAVAISLRPLQFSRRLVVPRESVRQCVEPSRSGDTGVRCANVVARLLASPTHFCAEATVFVMGGVPFALLGTGEARRCAGLDDCPDHR
jgi:hypothetical protein